MLIAQSKRVMLAWLYLSGFIVKLLESDLLNCETFETQCISMYQQEWDEVLRLELCKREALMITGFQMTLKHLSACFRNVVDDLRRKKPNAKQFSSIMGFITSYCSRMEF